MAEAANTPTLLCVQCNAPLPARHRDYCDVRCRNKWRAAERKAKRLEERQAKLTERACKECGSLFRPTNVANTTFCSKLCSHNDWQRRQVRGDRQLVWNEKLAIKRIARRSAIYLAKVRSIRTRRLKLIEYKARHAAHACVDCGSAIVGHLGIERCSPCGEIRARSHKRAARNAGKAKRRTATVETFDPIEVLERDRWRCHICGCKTPKALRGSYDDRAPELDHIVPIAAGGEHSRRNTACACRKCNIAKGAKPLGQMRLVA